MKKKLKKLKKVYKKMYLNNINDDRNKTGAILSLGNKLNVIFLGWKDIY